MQSISCTGAFVLSASVWLGGSALGYGVVEWTNTLPEHQRTLPAELVAEAEQAAPDDDAKRDHKSALELFLFILGRNATVYVWLLAGLLSAGIVTFLVLISNGISLGHTVGLAAQSGVPVSAVTDLILPHGVLEFGAFCIAGAVGFQGFRLALGRVDWASVKTLRLGWVFAFGAGALAVAAGVEAVVTASLAESLGYRQGA